jgi:hypothetical protein
VSQRRLHRGRVGAPAQIEASGRRVVRVSALAGLPIVVAAAAAAIFVTHGQASPMRDSVAAPVYVACQSSDGRFAYKVRPSRCSFTCRSCTPSQAGTLLISLRWRGWGGVRASATGTFAGNMDVRSPATIVVSGRARCRGRTFYRDAVLVVAGNRVPFALPPC